MENDIPESQSAILNQVRDLRVAVDAMAKSLSVMSEIAAKALQI